MSKQKQPASLFISHGAPTLLETDVPAHHFLRSLAGELPRPRAVVAVSAHFETDRPVIGADPGPETIHDFYGFSRSLHEFQYPVSGSPDIARSIADAMAAEGIEVLVAGDQGLDHGIWVPLALVWPEADVPVIPFSIQPEQDALHHFRLGQALARAVPEDVLIVASGSMTHNLREFRGQGVNSPAPDWVSGFADWIADRVAAGDTDALLDFLDRSPSAARNHPTDEHFLPFFVALGAATASGKQWTGTPLHRSYTYGVIAMDTYRFDRAA